MGRSGRGEIRRGLTGFQAFYFFDEGAI